MGLSYLFDIILVIVSWHKNMKLLLWPLKSCFCKIQLKTGVHLNKYLLIMWELDYKECWVLKNWCFWIVVLEKTLESPLDCKEIQPVHPKGDQSWVFIGRTDVEAETIILWPPDAKNWLIEKNPDAGKDWRQEEKETTEHEMVGWRHQLDKTWVWVNSRSWWWTGRPGVLQSRSWTGLSDWSELN